MRENNTNKVIGYKLKAKGYKLKAIGSSKYMLIAFSL